MYYTTTSGKRGTRPAPAGLAIPRQRGEPWSPTKKIVWGLLLFWLIPVGEIMIAVGIYQMSQPRWKARGLVDQAVKQPGIARSLLDKALALDPSSPQALKASAELHGRQSEWDESADAYEKYLAWMPDDWTAIANQAQAYLNAGRPDQAIERLQLLAQNAPLSEDSHASVAAHLAIAFLARGDPSQALEIVKAQPLQRRTLDTGLQQCLLIRAVCQYALGQRAVAIRDLDRLYAANAAFPNVQEIKQEMTTGEYQVEEIEEVHAARLRSSGQEPSAVQEQSPPSMRDSTAVQEPAPTQAQPTVQDVPTRDAGDLQPAPIHHPADRKSWQLVDGKWVLAPLMGTDEGQPSAR
jgi:tetratricopeptide (TPR) repeat protein